MNSSFPNAGHAQQNNTLTKVIILKEGLMLKVCKKTAVRFIWILQASALNLVPFHLKFH